MILGLTGGIATGKSTAANYFREKKIEIICADEIAKDIINQDEILNQISIIFGKDMISEKKVDRKKLREKIFKDTESVKMLNSITHPAIIEKIKQEIEKKKQNEILVVDIPLLFEGKYEFLVEKTLLISCEKQSQIERVQKRDSVSKENAINIINNQMSIEKKKKLADFIVENNGTIEEFHEQLEKILEKIKAF